MTLSDIETKVRYLINDISTTDTDIFTYTTSNVFTLTESNVISVSSVAVNDVTSGVDYTYDSSTNQITISSSLSSGDVVKITYSYYPNYSSTEIKSYIYSALYYLSVFNYYTFSVEGDSVYPEPEDNEANLIAVITAILIEPDNKSYRLPNLSIIAPRDLPKEEKIKRIVATFKKNSHGLFDIIWRRDKNGRD